ncbi:MAG TPA: M1 family aminopeptidase, partial [Pyrinomonadaceae bacterium]|nr:M1 family aminopeptidase [Pyrinomonadaceae bacterium]
MFVPQQYFRILLCVVSIVFAGHVNVLAQITGRSVYDQISGFTLGGGKAEVTNLVLKRDRVSMTFNGTFYFSTPVGGQVTGAVFIGTGVFSAEMPPSEFEKANVRRLLKADKIASTFTSAILRFSDDTFDLIGKGITAVSAPPQAQKLATEFEQRMLKETGANIASRLTLSFLNGENPGVFIGTFEGGDRDRFSYVFDPYGRIPTATFDVNGGEKGLVFSYKPSIGDNEIWTAFYGLDDYARNSVTYSDQSDLVDIGHYSMQIDLRTPKSKLGLRTKITMQARVGGVRAIPFTIGESLDETDDARLKKQLRLKEARLGSAKLDAVQEDWEGGFTVFLPEALQKGQTIDLEFDLEGDFMRQAETVADCSYPRSNESWYPRHGYLDRATYDFTFLHPKKLKIASVGLRESETPFAEDKDITVTKYKMAEPIALATFALGPWERHPDTLKWEGSDKTTPLEFNSVPGSYRQIKEDFILAELSNSVRFFNLMFGAYPYQSYSATFHPYGFGQGFPSMLMIPDTDRANKYTYSFISHETAHQWWGNIVAWRSYRDQWLSEGFAEY